MRAPAFARATGILAALGLALGCPPGIACGDAAGGQEPAPTAATPVSLEADSRDAISVRPPDGDCEITLELQDAGGKVGAPAFHTTFRGRRVVENGRLGVMDLFSDPPDPAASPTDLIEERSTVDAAAVVRVRLAPAGGAALRLTPAPEDPRRRGAAEKEGMVFPGRAWRRAAPESQGVDPGKLGAAMEYLGRALGDHGGAGTVFIARGGFEIWAGPDADKEHQIFSATKSFTGTVLGLLIHDGKVSLDTLAKDIDPALAEWYPTVKLRHFATMTSGYDSAGGSYEFDAQGRGDSWNPGPPAPPLFPPGSKFRYWDDAMSQFGSVLTKAAGAPLDRLFKERIADPIGMTRWRWTENNSPGGRVLSWTGGIWTSSRELARFGHLFLNRGSWNGRQLVEASWVDKATSVQVPASVPNDALPRSRGAGVYGFNWWVNGVKPDGRRLWPGAPPRTYYANGLHNNVCVVVPEWNLVLARTGGGRKDGSANTPPNVDEIWSDFFGRLAGAVAP